MKDVTCYHGGIDESGMRHLAEALAFIVQRGDLIALKGGLGAGKTTFARAFIRGLVGRDDEEIPSPTFTIVQTYDGGRLNVSHFDLYRLSGAGELVELGFEQLIEDGVAVVEWPERAEGELPADRLTIEICDSAANPTQDGHDKRDLKLIAMGMWAHRLNRLQAMLHVIDSTPWRGPNVRIRYFQGDASARRYARLEDADGRLAILIDSPRNTDGPPIRGERTYGEIAHLAQDVRPFVAIAETLKQAGFNVPDIYACDLEQGFVVCEDLGDGVFGSVLQKVTDDASRASLQETLWQAAVDTLIELRQTPIPDQMSLPDGTQYRLHKFDGEAFAIETELLTDWYWPYIHNQECRTAVADRFCELWSQVWLGLAGEAPHWLLRDFHSPNLLWCNAREGKAKVGIIDFQDAMQGPAAYDLVSLLQDARLDVDAALEDALLAHYCKRVSEIEPAFDAQRFQFCYRAVGAQRNTKILGIFARLAKRDGKTQYLQHIGRIWRYLERDLEHPKLADLKAWYDGAFPNETRVRSA